MNNLIWARRRGLVLINNEKTCNLVNFANHKLKMKESEKIDKYMDIARKLKKRRGCET